MSICLLPENKESIGPFLSHIRDIYSQQITSLIRDDHNPFEVMTHTHTHVRARVHVYDVRTERLMFYGFSPV